MHAFDVLGDPVRRRILELLAEGEQTSGAVTTVIRAEFGITQPAVSQHLRVLRDNGFATVRPDGARRLYAVDHTALRQVDEWLAPFRRFWAPHLSAMATEVARGKRLRRLAGGVGPTDARERAMIEVKEQISNVRRSIGTRVLEAGEARVMTISQAYDTDQDDLWDVVTNPERIPRWFLPVSGDLTLGGKYQFEGNAGGTITKCDRPHAVGATWEFGGQVSWVEVRITPEGDGRTRFELEHVAHVDDEHWEQYGPGAVGLGWEGAFWGLANHLATPEATITPEAAMEWATSPDGITFMRLSADAWTEADIAFGTDPERARRQAANTLKAYTGQE